MKSMAQVGVKVVSSPDLIRRMYKAIHAGVGFGSGTETRVKVTFKFSGSAMLITRYSFFTWAPDYLTLMRSA